MAVGKQPCSLCQATSEELEYYKFPSSRELREAWIDAIGSVVESVCSSHFTDGDYCHMRGRRRLRASAVPSRLLAQKSPAENESMDQSKNEENLETVDSKDKLETTNITDKIETTNATDKIESTNARDKTGTTGSSKKKLTKKNKRKYPKSSNRNKTESSRSSPKEAVSEKDADDKANVCVKENGDVSIESTQNEEKDIEDMITNYQIKQTKTLADRLNPEPLEDLIPTIMASQSSEPDTSNKSALPFDSQTVAQLANRLGSQLASRLACQSANKLDEQLGDGELVVELEPDAVGLNAEPVFIEVSVDKGPDSRAASPQDCLMLLESVQCEVDPSSLMLPHHGPDTDSDMEIVDARKEDPISLLTSSDEDEVIIQEPHIDTVDVSDETDEDDRPLQRLVKPKPPKQKKPIWFDGLAKSLMPKLQYHWGVYQYYCEQCNYRTASDKEFKQHMVEFEHPSIPLQVCPTCNYSTGSKAQFARHRRKHKDERNYKCHLCHYKARHNMSLMYHLKSHQPREERNPAFVCDKCGFSTDVKSEGLKHIKACIDWVVFRCDLCSYNTKRRSDLKRHRMRRHSIDDNDADFAV